MSITWDDFFVENSAKLMEKEISKLLTTNNIKFVRVLFCDNANIIRSKAFHINVLPEHFHTGVSITVAQQAFPVMYDAAVSETGLGPIGEAWVVPDWSTLNLLPYTPTHASVIGDMLKDGKPWCLCPRGFLKRMITAAKDVGDDTKCEFLSAHPPPFLEWCVSSVGF